ncbi:MAG: hypothetical protein PHY75_01070 [Bacteroidales bacterium]|nr:hypothetical protein [Bacteroidales bacterium]
MKKTILSICLVLTIGLFASQVFAQQGKFKGTFKYTLNWEGEVPQGVPTSFEVKVYEQKATFKNVLSMFQEPTIINSEAKIVYSLFDFSQIPVEGATGKWYVKSKVDDQDIAKNTYEFTSETKVIAGKNTKKVNVTFKSEDGTEKKETIWVCDEIGPNMDMYFYPGLKGVPFEFPVELEKYKITFTVSEIIEGKVKEADMLLPTGYEETSQEEFTEIINTIFEAFGGGQGGDDI